MAVQYMAKPAATAGPLLEKLGLNTHSFANAMANGGLMPALQLLHDHLDKVGVKGNQMAQVIGALFTKKGASGIDILENSLGKLGSKYTQTGSTANKQNEAWRATTHTLAFQMDQLKATIGALADKFGTYLIPKLQAAGSAVKDVIAWFEKHKQAAHDLAIVIGGVLGTAITVFAYTKAVQFIGATGNMITGMSKVVSFMTGGLIPALGTVEGANATAGASFTAVGTEASAAGAEVEAKTALMAGAVEADDAAIVTANETAGASFTALLGPIGLAVAALAGYNALASNPQQAGANAVAGLQKSSGHALNKGQLTSLLASTGAIDSTGKHGLYPWSQDNTTLIQSADKALKSFAGSGNASLLDGIIKRAQALKKEWPQDASALNTLVAVMNKAKTEGAGSLSTMSSPFGGAQVVNSGVGGGATGPGGPWLGAGGAVTPSSFAASVLARLGIKSTPQNIKDFTAWEQQEGGNWNNKAKFNPLNTTMSEPGAGNTGSQGNIKVYQSWAQGLAATVATLKLPAYASIIASLRGNASLGAFSGAVSGSPWGTGAITAPGVGLSNSALNALLDSGKGKKPKALGIPTGVENMLHLAEQLEGAPYSKANHAGAYNETIAQIKKFGTDCSGLVSVLLKEGVTGIRAAQTTQGLPTSAGLSKGTGKYVTVYDRHTGSVGNEHTLIDILGHYFESGGNKKYNPSGGVTALTAKQAAGELSGGGFEAFHPTNLNSAVRGGSLANVPGNNMPNLIAQFEAAVTAALVKAGTSLLQRFNSLVQSGTIRGLSAALGENTSHTVTTPGVTRTEYGRPVLNPWGSTTSSVASRLHSAFEGMGLSSNMGQINRASGGLVAAGAAGSQQDKAFQSTVANLLANGQKALAEKLVAAHKQAMQALGQEMYAQQALKDAESLQLQATQLKDQTTMQANYDADALNVVKAGYQLTNDKASAQVTAIRDMTQIIQTQFAGMVQAVEDHTQQMADAAAAVVTGINDQTQIQVDVLGEKGLFGLNLVAQKLQVQLDVQKASDDKAIAVAQQNLDSTTATWHAAVQTAQLNVDQVTAQQDLLAAAAQQAADMVAIRQEGRIASAQAKMDAVTMHEDVSVVGPAQTAVDMNANLPKAQQDVFNNILKKATGQAGVAEGNAASAYQGVYDSAQGDMAAAQQAAADAQNGATTAIAAAGETLATVTGEASVAIAAAQGTLTGVEGAAATIEAGLQGGVSVAGATASTQFAGSGAVINIYGVPTEDAGAIGNAASWALRTAAV
jgi:hypothetical protein